ncbi:MAG: hypothetical protein STSR0004_14590 [Peptococcaceae bacterium]
MEEVNTGAPQNNKKTVTHGAVKIAGEVVKEVVQNMTGLKVKVITINVQGVSLEGKEEKEEV